MWERDSFARGDRFVILENGFRFESAAYHRTPAVDAQIPLTMKVEVERHFRDPERTKFIKTADKQFTLPAVI